MKFLCKNKYWSFNEEYNLDKVLYLLIDRPDVIDTYYVAWRKNNKGRSHRDYDLPVFIEDNGYCAWYKNGSWHRKNNRPARIFVDGQKEYWINDKQYFSEYVHE